MRFPNLNVVSRSGDVLTQNKLEFAAVAFICFDQMEMCVAAAGSMICGAHNKHLSHPRSIVLR
jgi:hypothetical protein